MQFLSDGFFIIVALAAASAAAMVFLILFLTLQNFLLRTRRIDLSDIAPDE